MDSLIRWPWECTAHPTRSSQAASDRARRTSADGRGSRGGPGAEGDDAAGGSIRCTARSVGPSKSAQLNLSCHQIVVAGLPAGLPESGASEGAQPKAGRRDCSGTAGPLWG